jgi:hypothetical protein
MRKTGADRGGASGLVCRGRDDTTPVVISDRLDDQGHVIPTRFRSDFHQETHFS